jgi:two-component system, LytTR family, sensor kinase
MTSPLAFAPLTRWRWIAALWLAAALFEASRSIFVLHAEGKSGGELVLFLTQFVTLLPWMLATPLIIRLAHRYPILPRPTMQSAVIHLLTLAAISLVAEAWSAMLQVMFNPWAIPSPPTFWATFNATLVFQALTCLFIYVLIVTGTYLVESRDSAARQMTETARLNEELSKVQLAALRRQMEPHFMFNTLNSIAGLVRDRRNEAAVDMIVGLSEFLRRASEDSHRAQVTLAEEVEYLQRYIDIQNLRFGDRIEFSVSIAPDLLDLEVPSLLLQPLVENAIKHSLSERAAGGAIRVTGEKKGAALRLGVYNDGPGFPPDWQARGVGLANLRTRLQILYGDAAEFRVSDVGDEGVEVVVTLPLAQA